MVRRHRQRGGIHVAAEQVEAARDAVGGPVRIQVAQRIDLVHRAAVDLEGDLVAGAEDVRLRHRGLHGKALGGGVAQAEVERAGVALGHRHVHVHLVGGARDGRRLDRHFREVAGALQALLRARDLLQRVPRALELAHLAADHLVLRLLVAGDHDASHVDAPARIDEEREARDALVAIEVRHRVDVGERIAVVAQAVAQLLGGVDDLLAREHFALAREHQAAQLRLAHDEVAAELDLAHVVHRPLGDGDGDVDLLAVGRDRDLRRIDVELEVAAVEIERAQRLQVGGELLLRVLVVLGEPGEPAGSGELHVAQQLALGEVLRADNVDVGDLGDGAFLDVEAQRHAVPLQRRDRGLDHRAVVALARVLALDLLLGAVEQRLVVDLGLGDAGLLQAVLQIILGEFLRALDVDPRDRGTLLHVDDEHVAVALQAHILVEAGRVERLDGLRGFLVVDALAHFHGEVREHRSGFGALDALDTDVLDDERLEGECGKGRGQYASEEKAKARDRRSAGTHQHSKSVQEVSR